MTMETRVTGVGRLSVLMQDMEESSLLDTNVGIKWTEGHTSKKYRNYIVISIKYLNILFFICCLVFF